MITQVLIMGQLGLAQCTLGEYMGQGSYLHIGRVQGSGGDSHGHLRGKGLYLYCNNVQGYEMTA